MCIEANRILRLLFLINFFAFAITGNLEAQNALSRISNSPYPASSVPDTLYLVNVNGMPASQQLTVVTLQGLLAKAKPRIMLQRGATIFQTDLSNNYHISFDSSYLNDFNGLVSRFASNISGYLLCNLNDTTANAAISVCGFFNAVVVTPDDSSMLNAIGLPLLYNVIGKGQSWALDTFKNSFSKHIITYQDTSKCTYLSDYSIFTGAFHYWDDPYTELSDSAYDNLLPNAVMMGWGADEHTNVTQCSQHGVHVNASDWASNLSTYRNFNVPTKQKNQSADTIIEAGTHTVCFVMTDGDNVQWITNDFATNPSWYASLHRGLCNIGWTLSPALAELAPTIMKYLYDSAASTPSGQDYFVAAASGLGYSYPDVFTPLDSAADITNRMMQKAGMSVLNIIGNSYNDNYFQPYLDEPGIDGILYFSYSNGYEGESGLSSCINGKPVISARFSMWEGFYEPHNLAQVINSLEKNPYSAYGYSLIDVHVWDNSVDSILSCVRALDSNIRVVTPDAFVKLFSAGVCSTSGINSPKPDVSLKLYCAPNPVSSHANISYSLPQETEAGLCVYDVYGQKTMELTNGKQSAGFHQLSMNTSQLSTGLYFIRLEGAGILATAKCVVVK